MVPRLVDRSGEAGREPRQVLQVSDATDEKSAAKQALAANLEGMIEGVLRTTQFATAATTKARGSVQHVDIVTALDATDDRAFTASSLLADLAHARASDDTAVVRAAQARQWWVHALLVLACLVCVSAAGYFTFIF